MSEYVSLFALHHVTDKLFVPFGCTDWDVVVFEVVQPFHKGVFDFIVVAPSVFV